MKLALLLNVVAPSVGGVLIMGHRGTAKSTAVRALADLLPPIKAVRDCAFNCDPEDARSLCDDCRALVAEGKKLKVERKAVPVVELPLGATEDRVCGTIDLTRAIRDGVKAFEPGLLARANRGFLYIDEVNLLEDHLVDLLLDVAATARNRVEREGVSAEHPSSFRLVGSGNPEEGELRPQLLDRFGLCVEVETVGDLDSRVSIVEHREAFDTDPLKFINARRDEQTILRQRILRAARAFPKVEVSRSLLRSIAELCLRLGVDGHRGEITVARAARARAAFEGRKSANAEDVRRVAAMCLRHRLRRDPLATGGGGARVQAQTEELFGQSNDALNDEGDAKKKSRSREKKHGEREQADGGESRLSQKLSGEELKVAPSEVGLKQSPEALTKETMKRAGKSSHPSRRRAGAGASTYAKRGRHVGAATSAEGTRSLAFDATLRASSHSYARNATGAHARKINDAHEHAREINEARAHVLQVNDAPAVARVSGKRALEVAPGDLRFKRFRAKAGALYIFLVDTSGSMAANRIGQAKGALAQLLRRSYVSRDRVALITFREREAQLLLAPSSSASRARKLLDELPVGGATPLAAGLLRALDVARRASAENARRVNLVVFTDGRANVSLGGATTDGDAPVKKIDDTEALKNQTRGENRNQIRDEIRRVAASLRAAGVASLVIDTQNRFTAAGEGEFLSDALGGRYMRLPQLISETTLAETLEGVGV